MHGKLPSCPCTNIWQLRQLTASPCEAASSADSLSVRGSFVSCEPLSARPLPALPAGPVRRKRRPFDRKPPCAQHLPVTARLLARAQPAARARQAATALRERLVFEASQKQTNVWGAHSNWVCSSLSRARVGNVKLAGFAERGRCAGRTRSATAALPNLRDAAQAKGLPQTIGIIRARMPIIPV